MEMYVSVLTYCLNIIVKEIEKGKIATAKLQSELRAAETTIATLQMQLKNSNERCDEINRNNNEQVNKIRECK
jgi:septal ring factor EnvC (AmiA/AmiB activator)